MPGSALAGLDSRPTDVPGATGYPVRLPTPLTPFVGREAEVKAALELLQRDDVRILTLSGPGGAGKTRMAIEIANRATADYPDGVVFVELAEINEADRLIPEIVRGFRLPEIGERAPPEMLEQFIGNSRMLLVLDNFDQIVDAAPAISELLWNCPRLKVLVTSRIVMNIQGEQEFAVPPLSLPDPGPGRTWRAAAPEELARYDAISLFVQRARAVQPDFELTADNSLAVVNVCRRLDGLPLAIELAAARIKILSPEALLSRLAHSLDVLSGGARDLPPRLQTMRAAIAWSFNLLHPEEQVLLQQLAVFAGGFTIEAAEAVCSQTADILSGISSLNDNSLVRRVEQAGQDPRFVMLETVREYGLEQLRKNGHEHETRERHALWMGAWMNDVRERIFGPEMATLLDQCEAEHNNLRAALSWFLTQGVIDAGLQLANDSFIFWMYRSYFVEANAWFEDLIARAGPEPSPQLARALGHKGLLNQALSNFDRAMELTIQGIEMARRIDDQQTYALATYHRADLLDTMGEFEEAEQYFLEALALFEAQKDLVWSSLTLAMLSLIVHRRGDLEVAGQMVDEGLARARESGYGWGVAICLNRQGRFASDAGDFEKAAALYQESLRLWNGLGDRWRVTRTLVDVAACAAMLGHPEFAARLMGAAEALNEPLATALRFADDVSWQRAHHETTKQLDPDALRRAWDRGRGMPWNQAVAEALEPLANNAAEKTGAPLDTGKSAFQLSPRETEVLSLLVDGRTDREIAEILFISPRTAQGHVSNIFNKLGANSRTAAVATALQSGLLTRNDIPT